MKRATSSDWKTVPLPEERTRVELGLTFSLEEVEQIQQGVIPEEMEDKWFVYWEGNDLYFHRSWTGICIYRVRFQVEEMGAKAVEAIVNRDPEQYKNTDDEYDARMIVYLIKVLLLRQHAEFPSRSKSRGLASLEQWSQVGRAGLGVHPDDEDVLH
jgi:hypothetical protein